MFCWLDPNCKNKRKVKPAFEPKVSPRSRPGSRKSRKRSVVRKEKAKKKKTMKKSDAVDSVPRPVRIPVTRGAFTLHDKNGKVKKAYHLTLPTAERHKLLDALARQKKGKGNIIGLYRGLLARRTLGKNRLSEKQKRIFTEDMTYLKDKYKNSKDWPAKKASRAYSDTGTDRYDSESESDSDSNSDSDSDTVEESD
jgi:hypothetical protein